MNTTNTTLGSRCEIVAGPIAGETPIPDGIDKICEEVCTGFGRLELNKLSWDTFKQTLSDKLTPIYQSGATSTPSGVSISFTQDVYSEVATCLLYKETSRGQECVFRIKFTPHVGGRYILVLLGSIFSDGVARDGGWSVGAYKSFLNTHIVNWKD